MAANLMGTIRVTAPRPTAVFELIDTLDAPYRAFVAPSTGSSSVRNPTKAQALDKVIAILRKATRTFAAERMSRTDTTGCRAIPAPPTDATRPQLHRSLGRREARDRAL